MGTVTAMPITVSVGGKTYELSPTIGAVRLINGVFGGLKPALDAVQALNFDAVAQIINAGTGGKLKAKEVGAIGEALWTAEDRGDAMGATVEFLVTLLNGGRPPAPATEEDAEADEGNA